MSEGQFNSIISLGSHCEPSDHYRRFFKQEPSSPFDWMITPIPSLLKILEDDGKQFGLKISPAMDSTSAQCLHYGCLYHHEFDKTPDNRIMITREALDNCRDKLSYKYQKMISIAKNSRPLFVRWVHPAEHPANRDVEDFIFTGNDVSRLISLLQEKIGHGNFHIAFIKTDENKHRLIDEGLLKSIPNISMHSYSELSREVIDEFWDKFYCKHGFISA